MTKTVVPNQQKGEVKATIDGTQYTFRITVNAMSELEALIECSLFDFTKKLNTGTYKVLEVRALIWAALQDAHPETSLEDAGRLIDAAGGLEAFSALIQQLMGVTTPDEDPRKARRKDSGTKRRRGTGNASSRTRGARA